MKGVLDILEVHDSANPDDAYIAYLPLAHVLELMSEAICFVQGKYRIQRCILLIHYIFKDNSLF